MHEARYFRIGMILEHCLGIAECERTQHEPFGVQQRWRFVKARQVEWPHKRPQIYGEEYLRRGRSGLFGRSDIVELEQPIDRRAADAEFLCGLAQILIADSPGVLDREPLQIFE